MSGKKKIPNKRINKFFSFEDFDLEISMGREAIEGDGNFTVVLFRVDIDTTQHDDFYGESTSKGINFKTPIELYVAPVIEEATNTSYNSNSSLRELEGGNLTFIIYDEQLDELDIDIKHGDYIGYSVDEDNMIYYSVTNAGEKNYHNEYTIMGYKRAFRQITCAPANMDEFNGF
jgi:hypothetical protein